MTPRLKEVQEYYCTPQVTSKSSNSMQPLETPVVMAETPLATQLDDTPLFSDTLAAQFSPLKRKSSPISPIFDTDNLPKAIKDIITNLETDDSEDSEDEIIHQKKKRPCLMDYGNMYRTNSTGIKPFKPSLVFFNIQFDNHP